VPTVLVKPVAHKAEGFKIQASALQFHLDRQAIMAQAPNEHAGFPGDIKAVFRFSALN
jgi:hypothetical protein